MNHQTRDPRPGFIGLGQMGQGMSMNLLDKHGSLAVCDADPVRLEPLRTRGAHIVESASALAKICNTVFLCLPSANEVRQVLFGDKGLLDTNENRDRESELLIVDTTTLSTQDAISIGHEVVAVGGSYSDCPVTGLPKRANDGTLTLLFGGDEACYNEIKPLLSTMGTDVVYCGKIGSGQAMKTVNNVIYNINIAALCEVIPLAVSSGLDEETVARVVQSGSSRSFASGHFVPKMLRQDFSGDFPMQSAYKDIENFLAITGPSVEASQARADAGSLADTLPVVAAMIEVYKQALENGYGAQAKSSMIRIYQDKFKSS